MFVIDAFAEKAPGITPYRYAFNNPISIIDPDGNQENEPCDMGGNCSSVTIYGMKGGGSFTFGSSGGTVYYRINPDGTTSVITEEEYNKINRDRQDNSNSSRPDWASEGTKVHQKANKKGLVDNGISDKNILKILNDATIRVDKFQKSKYSYMHAMLDGDDKNMNLKKAIEKSNRFVRFHYNKALKLFKKGAINSAWKHFGYALHTLQDATSPSHEGFQEWHDYSGGNWNPNVWYHASKELIYPGKSSKLQKTTNRYIKLFINQIPLPSGNLFN